MRNAQQCEVVRNLLATARENERHLVGQQQLRARDLEVADVHRYVLRLHAAPQHVDRLEALAQLHQVAKVLERAGAPAALDVHDVRRSGSRRKSHGASGQRHRAGRIDRVQCKVARRGGQRLGDQPPVHAHHQRRFIDLRAARGIALARIGGQHLHALIFEQAECGLVNRGDLVVRKNPQWLEGILEMSVGQRAIYDCRS